MTAPVSITKARETYTVRCDYAPHRSKEIVEIIVWSGGVEIGLCARHFKAFAKRIAAYRLR